MHFQSIIVKTFSPDSYLKEESIRDLLENLLKNNPLKISAEYINFITTEKSSIGIKDVGNITELSAKKNVDFLKVIVISPAEKMTTEAQNSLLKILEEPMNNTQILLITANPNILLDTIQSRCEITNLDSNISENSNQEIKAQVETFLAEDSLIERSKLIEKIVKEKNSRLFSTIFAGIMLKKLIGQGKLSSNKEILNMIELAKKTYIGLNSGTNIKLTLDNLNLNYRLIKNKI